MSSRLNRFNWLARHYDSIARLIFGKAIYDSQANFLSLIPPHSRVLIIGGGSGEILALLMKLYPSCKICYVEASSEMLSMAEKRMPQKVISTVTFIHGTEKAIPEGMVFDAIITNFFLDLFPEKYVLKIGKELRDKLNRGGMWLVSDFVDGGKLWQRMLLWIMYRFFVITCNIEGTSLPSWETQLRMAGMKKKEEQLFFGEFIKSIVYQKDNGYSDGS